MNKHYIIGTAGHIDHGKSTLTKALTGKETDRLKEEKERNISIELGFAPFRLPNGDQVSLIDVPGHEKFIRHMVAGVGGIDIVLLVIAADEGVMPQTKEHLQIIELLGINNGVIVLTKKDLVDPEFIELVEEEVKEHLKETSLKNAPIVSVASTSGEGIEELKFLIQEQLSLIPERANSGFFRIPIDRVFTLKGIGTVITGTVYSGKVQVGDELEILPSNFKVRVRSLQVHSETVETAYAGQRVAINITGVEVEDISRGDSIVTPKQWTPSDRLDIELNLLKDIDFSLKENSEVKFHIGTAEVIGRLIIYDRKEALPGETLYAQIKLEETIISSRKERFIIRRPSPSTTIGGGIVIDPNATKHKYRPETIEQLKQKINGSLDDLILHQLNHSNKLFFNTKELSNAITTPEKEIEQALKTLLNDNKIIQFLNEDLFAERLAIELIERKIDKHLLNYHDQFPLRMGQSKAELVKQFLPTLRSKTANVIFEYWQKQGLFEINDEFVNKTNFSPSIPDNLIEKVKNIEEILINQHLSPDTWDEITTQLKLGQNEKTEIYNFLLNQVKIIKLTDKIVIHITEYEKLKKIITDFLLSEGTITLQQAKDLLQVSRKYLVPLMERLDQDKVTVLRQGQNYRELRKQY